MKKLMILAMMLTSSFTWSDVSGSVSYTNDYIFRGVSQGDGNSLQLNLNYEHSSGFYAGAWTGDVDFGDADRETDYYVGFMFPVLTDKINLDVGYVDYKYDNSDYDVSKYYVGVQTVYGLSAYYYQTDDELKDEFTMVSYTLPFTSGLPVPFSATIEYMYFEEDEDMFMLNFSKDINDWNLSVKTGEDMVTKSTLTSFAITRNF